MSVAIRRPSLLAAAAVLGVVGLTGCGIGDVREVRDVTTTTAFVGGVIGSTARTNLVWRFDYRAADGTAGQTVARLYTAYRGGAVPVGETLYGLKPATIYHVRLCASDVDAGLPVGCHGELTFKTAAAG